MSRSSPILQNGIGWILRAGVAISLVLESLGILLNYLRTGDAAVTLSSSWLAGGGNFFGFAARTVGSLSSSLSPVGISALGVIVLMLTPYARIIAAVVYYGLEKDWKYVSITLFVFSVITVGLVVL